MERGKAGKGERDWAEEGEGGIMNWWLGGLGMGMGINEEVRDTYIGAFHHGVGFRDEAFLALMAGAELVEFFRGDCEAGCILEGFFEHGT